MIVRSDHTRAIAVCERIRRVQDRYVGDVGDFGKYALLRHLCDLRNKTGIRLGVLWCLFPNEVHNNDGGHIAYLLDRDFSDLDPELHLALNKIVMSGVRSISSVNSAGILPSSTVFHNALILPRRLAPVSRDDRLHHRSTWLESGLKATVNCDLVFFDPDNGLEVASIPKHHPLAGKYIYWDELIPFWSRGQTLLIYHHLNRTMSAARQIDELASRFEARFKGASIRPLVFRRGSCRVFWLVHHDCALGRTLEGRARDMLNDRWPKHFRPFGWPATIKPTCLRADDQ